MRIKKTLTSGLALAAIFFCGCQPVTENTSLSGQKNETHNQSEIRVSSIETDSAEPAIETDADGNFYVVFVEHNSGGTADVFLQKFDKDAKPSGEKIRVNPENGRAKAWFGDPPTVKIGSDNAVYIGWTAKVESKEKPAATTLYLSVSRDGGKTFGAAVKVNDDDAPASHAMHSLEIGLDGKIFMAWLDERNIQAVPHDGGGSHEMDEPNSEIFFAASNDGGKTFSKNLKLSSEVCPCCKTDLAVDSSGKIYASWRQVVGDNFRHIAVASSDNNGENFSEYKIVSDDRWQINACPVSGAAIYLDAAANPEIFWFTAGSAGKPGVYAAKSSDGGKTFAPRELIYDGLIKGTPEVFVTGRNDFGLIFGTGEEIVQTRPDGKVIKKFPGAFPAVTVSANGAVYTAFVREENEKRGVWLSRLEWY